MKTGGTGSGMEIRKLYQLVSLEWKRLHYSYVLSLIRGLRYIYTKIEIKKKTYNINEKIRIISIQNSTSFWFYGVPSLAFCMYLIFAIQPSFLKNYQLISRKFAYSMYIFSWNFKEIYNLIYFHDGTCNPETIIIILKLIKCFLLLFLS